MQRLIEPMQYFEQFPARWTRCLTLLTTLTVGFMVTPATSREFDLSGSSANQQIAQRQEPRELATIPSRTFRDCPDCPEMLEIPAGQFIMGSVDGDSDEKPAHEVSIPKPFAIGKFEVTFAEWEACAADGGCLRNKSPSDEGWGKGRRPVINISWNDAKEYLTWLSQKTGKSYRFLTEAEWEYAARAGTKTRYAFGDSIDKLQAQFSNGKPGTGRTVEVGSFAANAWGLHDMHGNVWEWVEDCYLPNYVEAPSDGSARTFAGCASRVLRGGSWDYEPQDLGSAVRYKLPVIYKVDEVGIRVARDL